MRDRFSLLYDLSETERFTSAPGTPSAPAAPEGPSGPSPPPPPPYKFLESSSTFFCPSILCHELLLLIKSQSLGFSTSLVISFIWIELICS